MSRIAPLAFANAGKASEKTTDTTTATDDKTKKAEARVIPVITAIRNDIPIPEAFATARGSKSPYDFDGLQVGGSFGIANKTAKQISSIVSNQNRKDSNQRQKIVDGVPQFVMTDMKDANGNSVGQVPTTEKVMEPIKEFRAADVEPTKDIDGASVRVWRLK